MRALHLAVLVGLLVGCGSSGSGTPQEPDPGPTLNTGYPGDEMAIAPPDPAEGFQLHYGPKEYTEEGMADYLIGAGEEAENCYTTTTPNEQDVLINAYSGRMRPGSHHLIVWGLDAELAEELGPCPFNRDEFIVGSQQPAIDITDEHDEGMAFLLPARTPVALDLHYLNTTGDTLLREAWMNFGYADPAKVTTITSPIMFIDLGIAVPPLATHIEHSACEAPADLNVRMLTGHMHARGVRFTAWVTSGGQKTQIYEAYDWGHPGELYFSDHVQNDPPDPAARKTGGASGNVALKQGDLLEWECEFENTTDREYHFGDSAETDEMCNVFGFYYPSLGESWRCFVTN